MSSIVSPVKLVDHQKVEFEGLAAASAIMMALAENSGIRALIDTKCSFDRTQRILSPGMCVKCMIGPIYDFGNKLPLVAVERYYIGVPCDMIFGKNVGYRNLNDDALGRGLDTLAENDLSRLMHESSELCMRKYGFVSQHLHDDGSNYKFYGQTKDVDDGEIFPAIACHPKDGRKDLLHYCFQMTVDENRIVRLAQAHRGNITDVEADRKTIEFLSENLTEQELSKIVYVADAKMATMETLKRLKALGIRFLTRCPKNFGMNLQQRAFDAAMAASADTARAYPESKVYDLVLDALDSKHDAVMSLRVVVDVNEKAIRRNIRIMESRCAAKAEDLKHRFEGKIFDSVESLEAKLSEESIPMQSRIRYELERFQTIGRYEHRGRPPKDAVIPMKDSYRITRISLELDEDAAYEAAKRETAMVLITDIPLADQDRPLHRDGMTAEGIIRTYREEYAVEHCIRFTKSGVGIDQVFLQTPSRERAMMFVVSEIALLNSIADAIFRRRGLRLNGEQMTMNNLMRELRRTNIEIDRSDMRMYVRHPEGKEIDLFRITDALEINPRLLLGFLDE